MSRRGMGEYREGLPDSVPLATPNLGQTPNGGKLRSPIIRPSQPCTPKDCADYLCEVAAIQKAPGVLNWQFSPGAGDQDFLATGTEDVPGTGYAPTNAVVVAEFVVSEGYRGLLEWVGLTTVPATGYQGITWQLRISGQAVPKWTQNPIPGNHIENLIPFRTFVPVGKTLQLVAINTTANGITCQGLLKGFMRPVSDKKWVIA